MTVISVMWFLNLEQLDIVILSEQQKTPLEFFNFFPFSCTVSFQGNKKGPVGRWDFDTQEEYSDYMNQREAMPKAAFQYGVKMADGRKTRRIGGNKEKDRNQELNREWQQIQQILKRRKDTEGVGGGSGGGPWVLNPTFVVHFSVRVDSILWLENCVFIYLLFKQM